MTSFNAPPFESPTPKPNHSGIGKFWIGGGLVLIVLAGGLIYPQMEFPGKSNQPQLDVQLHEVASGPLTISVTEAGVLRSTVVEILECDIWGDTTVISIVAEGSKVKAGDLLIELDSSQYEDYLIQMEIQVGNARAYLVKSQENLKILEQESMAAMLRAEVRLNLAELDLQKYKSEGGEYEQQVQRADAFKTKAENDVTTAADQFKWSDRLKEEGFITTQQWDRDRLTEIAARLRLKTAENSVTLLERFTRERALELLQSNFEQTQFAIKKEEHRTQSNLVNAKASLYASEVRLKREEEKMERVAEHVANCKIYAPVDGMVVYATSVRPSFMRGHGDMQPLGEGSKVYQRQELIRLPDMSGGMTVDVKLHEAVLDKVEVGQVVRITTEALPGKIFEGRLKTIGVLPDASKSFINPDLKVYRSEIAITSGDIEGLRPGMSCQAEILIDHHSDTIVVPIQSVLRRGAENIVHVMTPEGPQKRVVETGSDNSRMIQIRSGLKVGEKVLLAPPPIAWEDVNAAFARFDKADIDHAKELGVIAAQKEKAPKGQGPGQPGAKRGGGAKGGAADQRGEGQKGGGARG